MCGVDFFRSARPGGLVSSKKINTHTPYFWLLLPQWRQTSFLFCWCWYLFLSVFVGRKGEELISSIIVHSGGEGQGGDQQRSTLQFGAATIATLASNIGKVLIVYEFGKDVGNDATVYLIISGCRSLYRVVFDVGIRMPFPTFFLNSGFRRRNDRRSNTWQSNRRPNRNNPRNI